MRSFGQPEISLKCLFCFDVSESYGITLQKLPTSSTVVLTVATRDEELHHYNGSKASHKDLCCICLNLVHDHRSSKCSGFLRRECQCTRDVHDSSVAEVPQLVWNLIVLTDTHHHLAVLQ